MADIPAVLAEGLHKTYGRTVALAGLDLSVAEGSVHAVLGPNGAGKTTAVRILATLLRPDAGRARVLGLDVVADANRLRSRIGLAGQYAAIDGRLTGAENLEMFGRLYRLPARTARARAAQLLERFDLTDAAGRPAATYSGGMRRRLDLAASLIIEPPMLFLDEPTTGLDPRSRLQMWGVIESLARDGATVLLTTQYLEEADRLAHKISVVDHGRAIAEGTADELKAQIGGDRLEIEIARGGDTAAAAAVLSKAVGAEATVDASASRVSAPLRTGAGVLADVVRGLDDIGVAIIDIAMHRPSLDDVFLVLTGQGTAVPAQADAATTAGATTKTEGGLPESPHGDHVGLGSPRAGGL